MTIPVYHSGLHFGEEQIVPGNHRSGMVVFSGCHLRCRFCYTPETSVHRLGTKHSAEGFEKVLERLRERGAENINLVSPTHVWNAIEPSLKVFFRRHPSLPLVVKISGYESVACIRQMAQLAAVFVPDFKVMSPELAHANTLPSDYGTVASRALEEMLKSPVMIVVRHLLMPGAESDSQAVVDRLQELGFDRYLNLMTQFIEPGKGLIRAPRTVIEGLVERARAAHIPTLVDGKDFGSRYVA